MEPTPTLRIVPITSPQPTGRPCPAVSFASASCDLLPRAPSQQWGGGRWYARCTAAGWAQPWLLWVAAAAGAAAGTLDVRRLARSSGGCCGAAAAAEAAADTGAAAGAAAAGHYLLQVCKHAGAASKELAPVSWLSWSWSPSPASPALASAGWAARKV